MDRVTVYVIVEGYSENGFLKKLLAEPLAILGIDVHVPIVGKASRKGGLKFRTLEQVCAEIIHFMRLGTKPYVTTFFDFYGLPTGQAGGWDFVDAAKQAHTEPSGAATAIEEHIQKMVANLIDRKDLASRFRPYLQLHELEALYFSQPNVLATTLGDQTLERQFIKIVSDCGECERINDSPETAPSKRIEKLFSGYKKGRSTIAHAPRLGANLELSKVRSACPRFDTWVSHLESLASAT